MGLVRTAIFDLDGTLVDTSGDMLAAANAALGGDVLDQERHRGLAFAGGRAMLREGARLRALGWDETDIDAAYPAFLDIYERDLSARSEIYPAARRTIDVLKASGWRMVICTNKPERMADRLLQDLGWRSPFEALVGADTLTTRKPDPAPVLEAMNRVGGSVVRSVMIGDSNGDVLAAKRAGMQSILVRFGVDPWTEVSAVANGYCDVFSDLPEVMDRVLPTDP